MPNELTTMEKYVLAHILLCGAATVEEANASNSLMRTEFKDTVTSLRRRGYISHTLLETP